MIKGVLLMSLRGGMHSIHVVVSARRQQDWSEMTALVCTILGHYQQPTEDVGAVLKDSASLSISLILDGRHQSNAVRFSVGWICGDGVW